MGPAAAAEGIAAVSLRQEPAGASRVAVVGGGLAGLAASVALARRGLRVELFEAMRHLGGRAGSFLDPQTGQQVDHCQHVAMGCCTNLAHFCRTTGIDDCFTRHRRLHFFGPDGRRSDFAAVGWLPAPLHLLPGLLRLKYLNWRERLGILRAMGRLARLRLAEDTRDTTVGDWLRAQGQTEQAIERFWSPVLLSALSETPDRASLAAARKVFLDGFLGARRAYEVEVPNLPLGEIYDRRLAEWLAANGVAVHLGARVRQIDGDAQSARQLVLADGTRRPFERFVVAVPWHKVRSVLSPAILDALPGLAGVEQIQPAAITAVHLWLDRPVTSLLHAVLVGRLSQWLFNHGRQPPLPAAGKKGISPISATRRPSSPSDAERKWDSSPFFHYYQVVISASHAVGGGDREQVAARVLDELKSLWPAARAATLLHHRIVTNPAAVFSVRPGLDALRPPQETPIRNLALAGDWTATGWPATMEGAVRSGYLAAEAVLRDLGLGQGVLVPDLPRATLARWLFGP